jgi:Tfp pilus assembly protein PilX
MDLVIKIFTGRLKSENGFVLVAAIMAVMIMLAVGFFILTTSTQDIRISSRLVGERRAISAAECGAQAIYASPDDLVYLAANPIASTQCDATNDPDLTYTATTQVADFSTSSGYDLATVSASPMYETIVTGTDAKYGTSASITIGMKPPAGKAGTGQGPIGSGGG